MNELFFGDLAPLFSVPALIGTGFFLVRLVLMLGLGDGLDLHADDGAGFDLDHGDSGAAFKILSLQAISAFLMGFGWGGIGAYRGWGMPVVLSVPVGFAFGGVMMWILAKLLRWISRMQSSGTVDISSSLLQEGTVYAAIPARGSGKGVVRVVVDDRLRYYNAVSDGDEIDSRTKVLITEVSSDENTVTVTRLEGGS
jgi:hypothetical protein